MKAATTLPEHLPRIDVLRAYAILMVIGVHFCAGTLGLVPWRGDLRAFGLWAAGNYGLVPLTYGWAGVPLFFVISGFCIHYAFLRRGDKPFRAGGFFWRRFARLYPAYLAALFFFILLAEKMDPSQVTLSSVLTHLFLVNNLSVANFATINGVYWSLGVECQFYLLYPLLLWGRKRFGLPRCFAMSLVINLVCWYFITRLSPSPDFQSDPYRSFPLMTWCNWVLGACVAEGMVSGQLCFARPRFFLYLTLLLSVLAVNYRPLIGQAYLFVSAFFAVLLQGYLLDREPLNWREKSLMPIGVISYSLYLWHDPLISPIIGLIGHLSGTAHPTVGILMIVYLPLTCLVLFGIAWISYDLMEKHARRILTRWRKRSPASIVPVELAVLPID